MVIIFKFCKKKRLIQPQGEPREHHLGEVQDIHKISIFSHFEKIAKKFKMKSQEQKTLLLVISLKKFKYCAFFGPVNSILIFLISRKCAGVYRPFRSFCLYEIFCSSNFYNWFFCVFFERLKS